LSKLTEFLTKILLKSIIVLLLKYIFLVFFRKVDTNNFTIEDYISHLKSHQYPIEFYEYWTFHDFLFFLFNASTSKIQISLNIFAKFVMKILLTSPIHCTSNDIFFLFFGYVVTKDFTIKDYVPHLNPYQNLIEFCENCIFHDFSCIWMHQLEKFKSLPVSFQNLWKRFCRRAQLIVHRMIYFTYFLDRWLQKYSSLKITFLLGSFINILYDSI